jgi:hypothetical protein
MKKLYISPSTQYANIYYDRIHNERQVMEEVAKLLVQKLSLYQVEVIMRTAAEKPAAARPIEANALGVDYYIELHTNAYDTINGRGCETYYQVGIDKTEQVKTLSRAFAIQVNNQISAITTSNTNAGDRGIKARVITTGINKGKDANGELRGCNMPAILCEIEFHDTKIGCTWILNNINGIAVALTKGIVSQMGLVLKPVPFKVGDKVKIYLTADKYVTGQTIPLWVKRNTYTIQELYPKVNPTKCLLQEIKSWVYTTDIYKV